MLLSAQGGQVKDNTRPQGRAIRAKNNVKARAKRVPERRGREAAEPIIDQFTGKKFELFGKLSTQSLMFQVTVSSKNLTFTTYL